MRTCPSSACRFGQHCDTPLLTRTRPRSEWLVNQHRDSMASYIGHPNLTSFIAIVENESIARVKFNLMEVRNPPFFFRDRGLNASASHSECCSHAGPPPTASDGPICCTYAHLCTLVFRLPVLLYA